MMDIYILPKLKKDKEIATYEFFIPRDQFDMSGETWLIKKIRGYAKKWKESGGNLRQKMGRAIEARLDPNDKIFSYLKNLDELSLVHPSTINDEQAKLIFNDILRRKKRKHAIYTGVYGALTPATLVAAPFVPLLNWGVTAFCGYEWYNNIMELRKVYRAQRSDVKINYHSDDILSEIEKIALSADKRKHKKKQIGALIYQSEHEDLWGFYSRKKLANYLQIKAESKPSRIACKQ